VHSRTTCAIAQRCEQLAMTASARPTPHTTVNHICCPATSQQLLRFTTQHSTRGVLATGHATTPARHARAQATHTHVSESSEVDVKHLAEQSRRRSALQLPEHACTITATPATHAPCLSTLLYPPRQTRHANKQGQRTLASRHSTSKGGAFKLLREEGQWEGNKEGSTAPATPDIISAQPVRFQH
jgi:hypothetical protein